MSFENELDKNKYNLVFVREFHPFTRNFMALIETKINMP